MILLFFSFLKSLYGMKIPSVFSYFSTRMMLASLTSLGISIFLGPSFIKKLYELKIGQSIRTEDCPLLGVLHQKKQDTPTMGGALILFSMLISMLLWMDLTHVFTLILFITTIFLGLLGARDDYLKLKYKNPKGISAKKKLLIQSLIGVGLAMYLLVPEVSQALHIGDWFSPPVIKEQAEHGQGQILSLKEYATRLYVPFFKEHLFSFEGVFIIVAGLFIIFIVTGTSNAVNLTDGLDGLAAGCLIMVAGALGVFAFVSNHIDLARYLNILYIEGSGEIAIYLSAFVGACLGFLWYNSHPAQVFMGDTGSLALGGVVGVAAVLLKREGLLGLVGGIFVIECLSVILQVASYKLRNKKRIFLIAPLHHHYEYKGFPETKVVIRFWIIGLLLAILGIASLKFQ
jgi:phospho-N-acetylmuramoyl-pentapeptide-transferase